VDQEGGIVAYPTYPAAPAQAPRPTTVTVSTYLLWLTAAMSLVSGALTVGMVGRMADALGDLFQGTVAEGTEGLIVGISVFVVVLNLLFAAGLAILGIFNNRGRNGARITTWVLGGISLCCSGSGLAGTASGLESFNVDSSTDTGPTTAEVQAALDGALPSWYEPLSTVLTVISLLAILGAVILLMLPASNAFFRKVQPAWDPNQQFPYPGQPGYPGQSGQPGQPGYPAQPGYPSQPGYPAQPGYPPYPGQPSPGQPYQPGQPQPGQAPPGQPYQPGQAPPGQPYQPGQQSDPHGQPPAGGGLPPYPGSPSAPSSAPPASGSTPPTDPWGRPAEDDKRPPSDPTS
jgi:hypothetical protein